MMIASTLALAVAVAFTACHAQEDGGPPAPADPDICSIQHLFEHLQRIKTNPDCMSGQPNPQTQADKNVVSPFPPRTIGSQFGPSEDRVLLLAFDCQGVTAGAATMGSPAMERSGSRTSPTHATQVGHSPLHTHLTPPLRARI